MYLSGFVEIRCWKCDVLYHITRTLYDRRKQDGESFWCPNGHSAVLKDNDIDKLRRERDRAVQEQARLEQEAAEALAAQGRAERALQRHKKRAAAGTCPCCKRTFSNMAQHMKMKHPDFGASNVIKLGTPA